MFIFVYRTNFFRKFVMDKAIAFVAFANVIKAVGTTEKLANNAPYVFIFRRTSFMFFVFVFCCI